MPRHHGRPPLAISYFVGGAGEKKVGQGGGGRSYLDILEHFVHCLEGEFPVLAKGKEEGGFVEELSR